MKSRWVKRVKKKMLKRKPGVPGVKPVAGAPKASGVPMGGASVAPGVKPGVAAPEAPGVCVDATSKASGGHVAGAPVSLAGVPGDVASKTGDYLAKLAHPTPPWQCRQADG